MNLIDKPCLDCGKTYRVQSVAGARPGRCAACRKARRLEMRRRAEQARKAGGSERTKGDTGSGCWNCSHIYECKAIIAAGDSLPCQADKRTVANRREREDYIQAWVGSEFGTARIAPMRKGGSQ